MHHSSKIIKHSRNSFYIKRLLNLILANFLLCHFLRHRPGCPLLYPKDLKNHERIMKYHQEDRIFTAQVVDLLCYVNPKA